MYGRQIAMLIGAAALSAAAGAAQAADPPAKPMDFTVHSDPAAAVAPAGPKALKLDARRGRWGVTLNLQQPDTRESTWNDVQAGAYYHITPSLRVGGAVALGDEQLQPGPKKMTPDEGQPRVRLETQFKF
ncbi:MAG TPA: hypothetical protein VLI41_15430 [Phenylobacterium sp.]|uniref:NtrZ family periplasmic regulatory protein n=1 Tax=Phenylobacterium sp. TaxID=1871053 RepID=UPI002CDE6C6B|nr:hypothetical protein [Phenylobacterium sp.]HSV04586.1 hypothetical protein [Phenylobacterium sp.]